MWGCYFYLLLFAVVVATESGTVMQDKCPEKRTIMDCFLEVRVPKFLGIDRKAVYAPKSEYVTLIVIVTHWRRQGAGGGSPPQWPGKIFFVKIEGLSSFM